MTDVCAQTAAEIVAAIESARDEFKRDWEAWAAYNYAIVLAKRVGGLVETEQGTSEESE